MWLLGAALLCNAVVEASWLGSDVKDYAKPFEMGNILDVAANIVWDEKDDLSSARGKLKKAGSAMWASARETMMKNPNAILVHADPDVFIIDNLISHDECDRLVELFDARKASAVDPEWCFAPSKFGDLSAKGATQNDDGDWCFSDQKRGQQLADEHGRAISRSVMVTKKEDETADEVGRRMEAQAGLNLAHAYFTQLLEYSQGEFYEVHTDCSEGGNDPNDR
jgi:hypothetical protein